MMGKFIRFAETFCLLVISITYFIACETTPTTAREKQTRLNQQRKGTLSTIDGYSFKYKYFPASTESPSVIYIPGMDGRAVYGKKDRRGAYVLAPLLNKANFNFMGFDRADAKSSYGSRSVEVTFRHTVKRSKSGSVYFPTVDNKESATENIIRNEITSIIEFVEETPTHDLDKGIYLIGSSMGSWASLCTVRSFPEKIKGVIFLSPALLYGWLSTKAQAEHPEQNITNYFNSLIISFGDRPALAIGGKKDILAPHEFKDGSAFDGAQLLKNEIGPNVEVMEVSSSLHGNGLIEGSEKVRKRIVKWLAEKAYSK